MAFTARFYSIQGGDIHLAPQIEIVPLWFSSSTRGGPLRAEIRLSSQDPAYLWSTLSLAGKRVELFTDDGQLIWYGVIEELTVKRGHLQDGLSIRDMYNRVRIAYTEEVHGDDVYGITDWAENDESIDTMGFTKELLETMNTEANAEFAVYKRDTLLNLRGLPIHISSDGQSGIKTPEALLRCVGYFSTLSWKYYEQQNGTEENVGVTNNEQVLGQQIIEPMAFMGSGIISDLQAQFHEMRIGSRVRIQGAAETQNNKPDAQVMATDQRDYLSMPTDNLIFIQNNHIWVDENALTIIDPELYKKDDILGIDGTNINDGFYWIVWTVPDHIKLTPDTIDGEENPPGGVVYRGNTVTLEADLSFPPLPEEYFDRENVSGDVTMSTIGLQVAQSFQIHTPDNWTLAKVELNVARVNSPGDGITVELRSDSAGVPGSLLASATLNGMTFSETMGGETWEFDNTYTLVVGTTYWLVLKRSGAYDAKNFYLVEVDEDASYSSGALQLWDNVGWVARKPDASLNFRVLGAIETSSQIAEIINTAGQLITRTEIRSESGVWSNQTRDGETLAYDEVIALLDAGTDLGTPLCADVTRDGTLLLYAQPDAYTGGWEQLADGQWRDSYGRPLAPGLLPVGKWIVRPDIPSGISMHYGMSPRFVTEAEYDCLTNKIKRVVFAGSPNAGQILEI